MCGIARPTKPMGPDAAVAAPHSRVTASRTTARTSPSRTPSAWACSSPSIIALSDGPASRASRQPAAKKGRSGARMP